MLLSSCETPVDIDLDNEDPRVIVQALIRINTDEDFTSAQISFTTTADFFFQDRLEAANVTGVIIENLST